MGDFGGAGFVLQNLSREVWSFGGVVMYVLAADFLQGEKLENGAFGSPGPMPDAPLDGGGLVSSGGGFHLPLYLWCRE
jgi:hypothetical protein